MSATKQMLNTFFLPEDQDAFARSQGWQDAAQMCYYEDQQEVPPMTDNEVEQLIEQNAHPDTIARALGYESAQSITDELNRMEREEAERHAKGTVEYLAPPPSEILVLARQDAREVYVDDDVMSLYPELYGEDDMAGVY